jgi:hypothetical protein
VRLDLPHQYATGNEVNYDVNILGGHNTCMASQKVYFYFALSLFNYRISRDYR